MSGLFNDMPPAIRDRMDYLERLDAADRADGSPRTRRLRQIPRETGRLIATLLALAPAGTALEIGTSGGYSTLWLALACRETGRGVTTFEVLEAKAAIASGRLSVIPNMS